MYAGGNTGVLLAHDVFNQNQSTGSGYGGGLYAYGYATITQTSFTGNSSASLGGAVYAYYESLLDLDTFTNNTATGDGGAFYAGENTSMTNTVFTGNSSQSDGGGVYNDYAGFYSNDVFAGNWAMPSAASGYGGAIYNSELITVQNTPFTLNQAGHEGGAIYNSEGATLLNDTFNSNGGNDTEYGGAVYNNYLGHIVGTSFAGNGAGYSTSGEGGALYNSDYLTLQATTFANNSTSNEGGALINSDYTTSTGSTYTGNSAPYGGGVYTSDIYDGNGDSFTGNVATTWEGGAVYNDSDANIENSVIAGNSANDATHGNGGGIFNSSELALVNDTIAGNFAHQGGGVWNDNSNTVSGTNLTVANNHSVLPGGGWWNQNTLDSVQGSIFSGNVPDQCANDGGTDALGSGGHNLDTGATCAFSQPGDISNALTAQLGPLANNGGLTWTMAIPATSLANNADGGSCPSTDQRGVARPLGAGCDIGAYEFDGANKRVISRLYLDALSRNVDAGALAGWDASLRSGTPVSALASLAAHSAEHSAVVVWTNYERFLQRAPFPGDVSGWVNALQHGATDQSLQIALLSSNEYFVNRGGNTFDGWLTAAYSDVLGRAVDGAAQTASDNAHAHGVTVAQFATAIINSTEDYSRTVNTWYMTLLGRPVDAPSSVAWVNALQHGVSYESALAAITSSAEYFNWVQSH